MEYIICSPFDENNKIGYVLDFCDKCSDRIGIHPAHKHFIKLCYVCAGYKI